VLSNKDYVVKEKRMKSCDERQVTKSACKKRSDEGAYSNHVLRRSGNEKNFRHHVTRRCAERVFSYEVAMKGDAEKKFG
jgi:hypothetical protein